MGHDPAAASKQARFRPIAFFPTIAIRPAVSVSNPPDDTCVCAVPPFPVLKPADSRYGIASRRSDGKIAAVDFKLQGLSRRGCCGWRVITRW